MIIHSTRPEPIMQFDFSLSEMMRYLYLPVYMGEEILMPQNIEIIRPLVDSAIYKTGDAFQYVYVTARNGFASPDNPLNRPGWHTDGFLTDDINFIWYRGAPTRFAIQDFDVEPDHVKSLAQFEEQVNPQSIESYPDKWLYKLNPSMVHTTPIIEPPGQMRQFVKISLSNHKYNLLGNSHNYLFDYSWPLHDRSALRNDPSYAQRDYL